MSVIFRKIIFLAFLFLNTDQLVGQDLKTAEKYTQIWMGYFNQTRISNKWGIWTDLHLRTKDHFVDSFSQSVMRVGLTYHLKDQIKITAGYAYVIQFPGDNHKNISQPEHRGWQLVQWNNSKPGFRIAQSIRLEEKFKHKIESDDKLGDGYGFYWKFRYGLQLSFPLHKKLVSKRELYFLVSDEIHINFGKEILHQNFDQNRFFVGFSVPVNFHDILQIGYMNQIQQPISGANYKLVNAVRVFYFQNLDLRKNKSLLK